MKTKNSKEKVVAYIQANTPAEKSEIANATGVKGIVLEGLLSRMVKSQEFIREEKDGKVYFIPAPPDAATKEDSIVAEDEQPEEETSSETESAQEKKEKLGAEKAKRDNRKFKFAGEEYGKGALVHAVVKQFVADHKNTTLGKLKEAFPDELLQRFGIFQEIPKAKQFSSGGRDRFFMKDEQMIKLRDKKVVVCNQFTSENIKPFLAVARKLGYSIR